MLYLYGICASPAAEPPNVPGVDGTAAVEPVACGGLACWISRVAKSDFADDLARNMENLDWLAEVSVRHQRVVGAIAESADILPARFGTVFLTAASLAADVKARKSTLLPDLDRIRGCEEWGVKVFRTTAAPTLSEVPKTGRDYLQAKAGLLRTRPTKEADGEIERLVATLKDVAVEMAAGGAISGGQAGLQWQASFLIKRAKREQFQSAIETFSRDWSGQRRIECTGPWPPYSFVTRAPRSVTAEGL